MTEARRVTTLSVPLKIGEKTVNFEDRMLQALETSVIKKISEGSWLTIDWHDQIKVGAGMLRGIYDRIDMERVTGLILEKVETHLADKIFNSLATEFATDVKKIMSNSELREDCRATIRAKIRSVES